MYSWNQRGAWVGATLALGPVTRIWVRTWLAGPAARSRRPLIWWQPDEGYHVGQRTAFRLHHHHHLCRLPHPDQDRVSPTSVHLARHQRESHYLPRRLCHVGHRQALAH